MAGYAGYEVTQHINTPNQQIIPTPFQQIKRQKYIPPTRNIRQYKTMLASEKG